MRIVVRYPPGGTVDSVARTRAVRLSEQMGQPFVVENRAGAFAAVPLLVKNMPYDLDKDFTPIVNLGAQAFILSNTSAPEFAAYVKQESAKYRQLIEKVNIKIDWMLLT